MVRKLTIRSRDLALIFMVAVATPVLAQQDSVSVWTQHNDNSRTGGNTSEEILTPSNVNKNMFGKLFSYILDDQTYSQPLYVPGLRMSVDNETHNVVFVTTVNNTVYAWDADSNTSNSGKPLWSVSLTPPGGRPPTVKDMDDDIKACDGHYRNFARNMGIVGTPVIDVGSKTLYVVAHTVENGQHVQRLHALDITSGSHQSGLRPNVVIAGSYGNVSFNPQLNNQRPALALNNGVVYIGWSSYCDTGLYHGWIMGYRASDLTQVTIWSSTRRIANVSQEGIWPLISSGIRGGIWQAGQAVTIDSHGNLYLMTGNGSWDGLYNFSNSVVKLSSDAQNQLTVSSFFTPHNVDDLNGDDMDLGSAGVLYIPGTGMIVGGGKTGMLYLMNTGNLGGHSQSPPDKVVQEFQATFPRQVNLPVIGISHIATGHIHGSPVYFTDGTHRYVYLWGENDYLRAFELTILSRPSPLNPLATAVFNPTAVAKSSMRSPQIEEGMPGGFLSVSANGTSNGIIWVLSVYACDAVEHVEPGILYAFDASNFTGAGPTRQLTELWNSRQAASDDVGYFAKFTYPTVVNGKVYVAGWGPVQTAELNKCAPDSAPSNHGELSVYGLRATASPVEAHPLTGFADDVGEHVFYVDGSQHMQQLYRNPGGSWVNQDLTVLSNSNAALPRLNTPLFSFADTAGKHVLYLDGNQHVRQFYWSTGGSWVNQDLTIMISGSTALPRPDSPLSGFSDQAGEHVVYLDANQHVRQLFWSRGSNWVIQDLTAISSSSFVLPGSGSPLTSFADQSGEHVVYLDANQHVHQLSWSRGSNWVNQNLTAISNSDSALPNPSSPLTSFADQSGEHVVYLDANRHVRQLYWKNGGNWVNQDLTAISNSDSVLPNLSSPLTSFADQSGEHVVYLDANRHVRQLYWKNGGNWVNQDLTVTSDSNADLPLFDSLSSFADSVGEHVLYMDRMHHVRQLYWSTGSNWSIQDLTSLAAR
jgi:hypothetical protein